ncbi:RNA polymerase sigma factor [Bythopirellula goksoeyrii]|uniref:RNA polymerase sigma factor n=1 Tax=Bythopirellula goksoeyrii TaxID=1400387 RepID=A0A5B9QFW5_9BACT|nr:RNA polymerase sigma factor [Bythopirellula goksoeyrii]QEG36525.1 ECF RNA polymerase sigma factor SigE [Bythopirellula goksoeyrii]
MLKSLDYHNVVPPPELPTRQYRLLAATDEQLIAKFQASGQPADLDELVARHLERVRNLAYRVVLCNATADDVTQDVFIKVIRSAHTYRGQASVATWIYRITLNSAKEYLRKKTQAEKHLQRNSTPSEVGSDQPVYSAMQKEMVGEIHQALSKLSVKLRSAIVLTSMEHLPPKEAAAIAGCSTATMHWRVHQARKQLKQLLNQHFKP